VLANVTGSHSVELDSPDPKTLTVLLESSFTSAHKVALGSFYPARIYTSNVLLSFLYCLQTPSVDQKSYDRIKQVFSLERVDAAFSEDKDRKEDREKAK
jgi:hypothetical protein